MISRRKQSYPVSQELRHYLRRYGRSVKIPTIYDDLQRFTGGIPYEDPRGDETLWLSVMYSPEEREPLYQALTSIYIQLKAGKSGVTADLSDHLEVERIDFAEFGNSRPFRIRIKNRYNDNFDHYYVKRADASRVYGLELEHILSPTRINYLVYGNTLIEEHIAGVPGDRFIHDYLPRSEINRVRIAKEFVKFNQRCFAHLLGDMRTVNYVVDITPDFEETQYRVRPIDFDQQSYEGSVKVYLAQFFTDNSPIVELVSEELNAKTINQYKVEERTLIGRRRLVAARRLNMLFDAMRFEELAPADHVSQLSEELAEHHNNPAAFALCRTMGDIVETHLGLVVG